MAIAFQRAVLRDAADIAALRLSSAHDLTRRHGTGTWSFAAESAAGVRAEILGSDVLIAREGGQIIATLRLSTRSPWLGDINFFSPSARPLYLTSMVVEPARQRHGIGRQLLAEARRQARRLNGDAIRLDSYEGRAGAVEFYRKCGFREVHRAEYHGTPLVWLEAILPRAGAPELDALTAQFAGRRYAGG